MKLLKGDFVKKENSKEESEPDIIFITSREDHRITILDRQTGFMDGRRDTETGYRDPEGYFWLASGMFDIRDYLPLEYMEAVQLIKDNANNCIEFPPKGKSERIKP